MTGSAASTNTQWKPVHSLTQAAPPPHLAAEPPRGRILVVEDQAVVALDLQRTLRAAGYRVVGPQSACPPSRDCWPAAGSMAPSSMPMPDGWPSSWPTGWPMQVCRCCSWPTAPTRCRPAMPARRSWRSRSPGRACSRRWRTSWPRRDSPRRRSLTPSPRHRRAGRASFPSSDGRTHIRRRRTSDPSPCSARQSRPRGNR